MMLLIMATMMMMVMTMMMVMMMMMLVPSMRLAGLENESVPARVRGSGLAGGNRRENISLLKYYEYKVQPNIVAH